MADAPSVLQPQRILGSKKGFYKVSFAPKSSHGSEAIHSHITREPEWVPKDSVAQELVDTWRALRSERASYREQRNKDRTQNVNNVLNHAEETKEDKPQEQVEKKLLPEAEASAALETHSEKTQEAPDVSQEPPQPAAPEEAVNNEPRSILPETPEVSGMEGDVFVNAPAAPAADTAEHSTSVEREEATQTAAPETSNVDSTSDQPPSQDAETHTPGKEGIITSAVAAIRATLQPTPSVRSEPSTPRHHSTASRRVRRPVGSSVFTPRSNTVESITQEAQEFIQTITRKKDQLQEELNFVRNMYEEASSSAANTTNELDNAKKEIELLKTQLKDGLALQQQFVDGQRNQYEDQIAMLTTQLELLQGQSAQTDADVRRKAAEWDMHLEREREDAEQRQKTWAKWDERRKRDGLFYAGNEEAPQNPIVFATDRPEPTAPASLSDALSQELADLAADANEAGLDLSAPRSRRRRATNQRAEASKRVRVDTNDKGSEQAMPDTATYREAPDSADIRTMSDPIPMPDINSMTSTPSFTGFEPSHGTGARWLRQKSAEAYIDLLPAQPRNE